MVSSEKYVIPLLEIFASTPKNDSAVYFYRIPRFDGDAYKIGTVAGIIDSYLYLTQRFCYINATELKKP